MNKKQKGLHIFSLILGLIVLTNIAMAEMATETVRLHHKSADDLIPIVQPFLDQGGVISGDAGTIIIKTNVKNLKSVKQIIADLDTPISQLEISLSYNPAVLKQNQSDKAKKKEDATVRVYKPGESTTETQYYRTQGREVEPDLYKLQVLENRWATVKTGQAIPQVQRRVNRDGTVTESVSYRQVNSGFHIKPSLKGREVLLIISAFGETESREGGGKLKNYQTTSTVKTTIGNWIALSAATGEPTVSTKGKVYQSKQPSQRERQIYLKVNITP